MISVITGPPGSGKSTYIQLNARPGDIVIDMDRIASALWVPTTEETHSYPDEVKTIAREARNAAVKSAIQTAHMARNLNVWVIHTDPSPGMRQRYRSASAKFVHLDPGMDVCIERVKERNPSSARFIIPYIREYYATRQVR